MSILKYENVSEGDAPWGKRVRDADAVDLITIEAVKGRLDKICDG